MNTNRVKCYVVKTDVTWSAFYVVWGKTTDKTVITRLVCGEWYGNGRSKNAEQLSVVVKGDGKQYQLRLRVDQYLDGPAFVYKFQTSANKTQTLVVTEDDFTLMYRGRSFYADYQLNFDDVRSLGFMISEKQAGEFSLEVQAITPLGKI